MTSHHETFCLRLFAASMPSNIKPAHKKPLCCAPSERALKFDSLVKPGSSVAALSATRGHVSLLCTPKIRSQRDSDISVQETFKQSHTCWNPEISFDQRERICNHTEMQLELHCVSCSMLLPRPRRPRHVLDALPLSSGRLLLRHCGALMYC